MRNIYGIKNKTDSSKCVMVQLKYALNKRCGRSNTQQIYLKILITVYKLEHIYGLLSFCAVTDTN